VKDLLIEKGASKVDRERENKRLGNSKAPLSLIGELQPYFPRVIVIDWERQSCRQQIVLEEQCSCPGIVRIKEPISLLETI
jgi:hypothetical protein